MVSCSGVKNPKVRVLTSVIEGMWIRNKRGSGDGVGSGCSLRLLEQDTKILKLLLNETKRRCRWTFRRIRGIWGIIYLSLWKSLTIRLVLSSLSLAWLISMFQETSIHGVVSSSTVSTYPVTYFSWSVRKFSLCWTTFPCHWENICHEYWHEE